MGIRYRALEELVMKLFGGVYNDRKVLVTGHTGFKGSWLSLWLKEMGATVTGVSLLPETEINHWRLLNLRVDDRIIDIRKLDALQQVFIEVQPEIVFHLAAQPLVRRSYRDPLETWSTNVIGTVNILEACRHLSSVRAIVSVTTDKCYENMEWSWGYRESDRLGGHDPYSASKASAELVAASYRNAYLNTPSAPLLATARAGNVIGGGDWSEDRLIPDLVRALENNNFLEVRSPHATRPWQHVLESLSGYLLLGDRLLSGDKDVARAWNFGPEPQGNRSVIEVLDGLKQQWEAVAWRVTNKSHPHETRLLYLDSSQAYTKLGWKPVWSFEKTLAKTAEWYKNWYKHQNVCSRYQIFDYVDAAKNLNLAWVND